MSIHVYLEMAAIVIHVNDEFCGKDIVKVEFSLHILITVHCMCM